MGFLILLVIILFFVGFVFITVKINDLKYRAKQQVLRNTGISSSDISAGIDSTFEKGYLEKFLTENPTYTEESIRELLKKYTVQIFNRESVNEFSQKVCEKMQKDSKIDKMKDKQFKRTNINYYGNSKLRAMVIYADNKDEYNVYVDCSILGEKIQVEKYQIIKGTPLGF